MSDKDYESEVDAKNEVWWREPKLDPVVSKIKEMEKKISTYSKRLFKLRQSGMIESNKDAKLLAISHELLLQDLKHKLKEIRKLHALGLADDEISIISKTCKGWDDKYFADWREFAEKELAKRTEKSSTYFPPL